MNSSSINEKLELEQAKRMRLENKRDEAACLVRMRMDRDGVDASLFAMLISIASRLSRSSGISLNFKKQNEKRRKSDCVLQQS